ncbi:PQQ-binding-like beta-propeller repeat protein [Actinoplanes sp. NPDC049596]|uniref:outer membrane protein assembly factor BamB family protein n=1 Tax=unclassified Actinoplanes TaxID=2626549 RepID=UPI003441033F
MSVTSSTVIIDLGLDRGEPETYGSPGRSTFPGWFPAALLAVLVLFTATASAEPAKSPLREVFTLQIGPADAYAMTDRGQLLAQTFGLLSSYELDTGRTLWEAGQSTPAYRLRLGGGLVLMRPWSVGTSDPGTTAVSVADGVSRWTRAGQVVTVAGSPTLLAVTPRRSQSGAGRRVEGPIQAVDPLTGQTRWTVPVPASAVLTGLPGPGDSGTRMLLVHDDRTMEVRDLVTGERLVSRQVPPADYDPANPAVVNGLILLRHPGNPGMEISAYDPETLRNVWTMPAEGAYEIQACGMLACLSGPDGMRGIDPLTGDLRWQQPSWRGLQQFGAMYVAYGSPEHTTTLGLIDPDRGRLQVDLTGWRPVTGSGLDGHLLVTRSLEPGSRTMVAVARPGEQRPRLLADLPTGTGDCQSVPGRLVCRTMYGQLVVWAYGLKG